MYDLIVAGAGPAGSAAARIAARMGLDTLILEKEVFPRYKACGGAVSEKARAILDFSLPDDLCERAVTGARIHYRDLALERHKGYRLATMVSRSRFDHYLLQKAEEAGAKLSRQKILDYQEKEDCVQVETKTRDYRSRFLVISSGCQDHLSDGIAGPRTRDKFGICLVVEIKEDDSLIDRRLHDTLDIHFGVARMGYGWIFPHQGHYNVGIGGLADQLSHPRRIMQEFLKANGFAGRYTFHGHQIPLGGVERRLASSRVLLAGDSAGFVDGFSGEGIYYAIRSGQIASRVVSEKLCEESLQLGEAYSSRCREDFGDELRYALLLSRMLHSRPELLLKVLSSRAEIVDRYLEVLSGKSSYKDFVRWLLPRLPLHILRTLQWPAWARSKEMVR